MINDKRKKKEIISHESVNQPMIGGNLRSYLKNRRNSKSMHQRVDHIIHTFIDRAYQTLT